MFPQFILLSAMLIKLRGAPVDSLELNPAETINPVLNISDTVRSHGLPPAGGVKIQSRKGLNQRMYDGFGFNDDFNQTVFENVDGSFYYIYELALKHLRTAASTNSLTATEAEVWGSVQLAARESYYEERGAVVWDVDSAKWMFCGWLDLSNTVFLTGRKYIRLCGCMKSLGLDEITRTPMPNQDYFERETMIKLHLDAKKRLNVHALQTTGHQTIGTAPLSANSDGGIIDSVSARSESSAVVVNIFMVLSERYATDCISASTPTCIPSLCCYSAYMSSPFCLSYPVNCLS